MVRRIRTTLKGIVAGTLALSLGGAALSSPQPAVAASYVAGGGVYAPPTSGTYAYYPTYGAFGPDQSVFPRQGESFVDPVFGNTVKRLTNELGQSSASEIYSKNGYFNANGTLVHHRSPSGHNIISTSTGQVVRAGVAFNYDSSFAPDDPDAWYSFAFGDTTLYKYSVSTGNRTVVKTFAGALGQMGGSVDWIDRSGRYMVLNIGGVTRVYDKQSDTLYAGSIPGSYGGGGGWRGISPDGNYVITSTEGSPTTSHSWRIDHANKTVSTTPVLFWTACGGHADVVSASNGKTYFVSFDCHTSISIYAVDITLQQSASNVAQQLSQNRKLIQLSSWSDSGHFSRVSRGALQDWMYVSIESGDDGFSSSVSDWRAYKQEILMVNVLTGEVRRLAHHRSRGLGSGDYYYQPRVSASWDGSVVLWTSNFGYNGSSYADLYALNVAGGGGTSTLAASFAAPGSGATVSGTTTVTMGASGGSGGYTYALSIDGVAVSTSGASYAWDTKAVANGSHTLRVTARDSAGATASASVTVTVQNSTTTGAPTVTFVNPASGATVSGTITVSLSATGGSGSGYVYSLAAGGTPVYTGSNSGFSWNTTTSPNGSTTLTATVTDSAGGKGSVTRAVTVSNGTGGTDTSPPTVAITSPTSGAWTGNSINVAVRAADDVAVTRIDLWGGGKIFGTIPCSSATCTGNIWWLTGPLPLGQYIVNAVAVDKAGNRTVSAEVRINKDATSPVFASGATSSGGGGDITPPTAVITSPTSGAWTGNSINLAVRAADDIAVTRIDLWGGGKIFGAIPCSSATCTGNIWWLTGPLPLGQYIVNAVAVDKAGNRTVSAPVRINKDATSPVFASGVTSSGGGGGGDITPPTAAITSPPSGTWTGNSLGVSLRAIDNVAVRTIQLYANGALANTLTCTTATCAGTVVWLSGPLPSGRHTLTAVATDSSGNRTTSAPITIYK